MTPARRSAHWHAAPSLIWTHFDDSDDWVVFDPASADVHLLTAAAYHLWRLIADGPPRSVDALVQIFAAGSEHAPDEELISVVRDAIASMDQAGLIRPVSS